MRQLLWLYLRAWVWAHRPGWPRSWPARWGGLRAGAVGAARWLAQRLQPAYFGLALGLLGLEAAIALGAHDAVIRPYGGDFLVVILLYCVARSFGLAPPGRVVLGVLALAGAVEVSQHFHLIVRLGWQQSRLAHWVLGSEFAWLDLLAYALGGLLVLAVEKARRPPAARLPPGLRQVRPRPKA